ncbi:hypothetical protein K525DRAFT_260491 [Schizophyllum commune Loenen D]|nr:hypothetical protein K525DRAFT_260491 [Schizophyllum commune Loenen D]
MTFEAVERTLLVSLWFLKDVSRLAALASFSSLFSSNFLSTPRPPLYELSNYPSSSHLTLPAPPPRMFGLLSIALLGVRIAL